MLRRIEKYDLLEEIGHGGMATVYRARDRRLDRDVAIKVMHPHLRQAKEAQKRFTREAKSVAKLHHPNIMEIYDFSGEGSEESYIAAELLTGPTLKVFADEHAEMPPEIAVAFCIEIAQALAAAHRQDIIHRDVKPENVLLHRGAALKLTDFGIAQMRDGNSMTATGQILGSPGHMAPEQIDGKVCDERSDVFSLGTVLYFLAVGCLPFTGNNPHTVLKRIVDADFPDPLRVRPRIGDDLADIIRTAMALDPNERYASAADFEEALTEFLRVLGIADSSDLWRRYVAEPAAVADELRASVISKQTERGEAAVGAKDLVLALKCFNQVLAYDEANERVLAAIDHMGRRDVMRRRISVAFGIGLMLLGVVLITPILEEAIRPLDPVTEEESPPDASPRAEPDAEVVVLEQPPTTAELRDAALEDGRVQRLAASQPYVGGSRTVSFRLPRLVQNVQISVDGQAARDFGPSFRSVELSPGPHRFLFSGRYVQTKAFTRNIPPGRGPFPLVVDLRLQPARLYVSSSVPGTVAVVGESARGRTRQFVTIPMNASSREVTITVTAPGYRMYRGRVRLRVGETTEHRVNLEASGSPPPHEPETQTRTN